MEVILAEAAELLQEQFMDSLLLVVERLMKVMPVEMHRQIIQNNKPPRAVAAVTRGRLMAAQRGARPRVASDRTCPGPRPCRACPPPQTARPVD